MYKLIDDVRDWKYYAWEGRKYSRLYVCDLKPWGFRLSYKGQDIECNPALSLTII